MKNMKIIWGIFLFVFLCISVFLIIEHNKKTPMATVKSYRSVQVVSGDTVSDICIQYHQERHMNDFIKEVGRMNQIDPDKITDGNFILIPIY